MADPPDDEDRFGGVPYDDVIGPDGQPVPIIDLDTPPPLDPATVAATAAVSRGPRPAGYDPDKVADLTAHDLESDLVGRLAARAPGIDDEPGDELTADEAQAATDAATSARTAGDDPVAAALGTVTPPR